MWISRRLLVLLPVLLALVPTAARDVPVGVRYIPADDSLHRDAVRIVYAILALDTNEPVSRLVRGDLVVGPGLWRAVGSNYGSWGCTLIPARMASPAKQGMEIRLEGVAIRGCQPVFDLLDKLLGSEPRRIEAIRKLNREELVAHWSIVAGEVREPILTAEVGGKRVVFGFREEGGELFLEYLDEINEYWEMMRDGELRPVPVSATQGRPGLEALSGTDRQERTGARRNSTPR